MFLAQLVCLANVTVAISPGVMVRIVRRLIAQVVDLLALGADCVLLIVTRAIAMKDGVGLVVLIPSVPCKTALAMEFVVGFPFLSQCVNASPLLLALFAILFVKMELGLIVHVCAITVFKDLVAILNVVVEGIATMAHANVGLSREILVLVGLDNIAMSELVPAS